MRAPTRWAFSHIGTLRPFVSSRPDRSMMSPDGCSVKHLRDAAAACRHSRLVQRPRTVRTVTSASKSLPTVTAAGAPSKRNGGFAPMNPP